MILGSNNYRNASCSATLDIFPANYILPLFQLFIPMITFINITIDINIMILHAIN